MSEMAKLTESGSAGSGTLNHLADRCMKQAREALHGDKIDDGFFERYRRILIVLKLIAAEDNEEILTPALIEAVNHFDSVNEEDKLTERDGVGVIGEAIAQEIISLNLYLLNHNTPVDTGLLFGGEKALPLAELIEKDHIYYKKGEDTPFTGVAVSMHKFAEAVRDKTTFEKGVKSGRRVEFHAIGVKSGEGMMKNNLKDGLWIYYDYDGEIEHVTMCHSQLRFYFRGFIRELEQGNPGAALQNLDNALKLKPLACLKEFKEQFALYQGNYCLRLDRFACAIKYGKLWAEQVEKSGASDNRSKASAFYQLGVYIWHKLIKQGDQLDNKEKEKVIAAGLQAFEKSLHYDKLSPSPYAYMSHFYRAKAKLYPDQAEEYTMLEAKSRERYRAMVQSLRQEEAGEDNTDFILPAAPEPGKRNVYEIKEDDLQDIIFEKLLFPPPPPAPPPPRPVERNR